MAVIFHADCNNFFASCECLERPELKDVPMAVAGDPENRKGVVVAKNELAKRYGVKTTDTVYQARKKCPGIVFVPPRTAFTARSPGGSTRSIWTTPNTWSPPRSTSRSWT